MTPDETRRRILEEVSAGTLSPADAADQLAALDHPSEVQAPNAGAATPGPTVPTTTAITRIRVEGSFRSIDVVGDAGVVAAVAQGPHRARQEGATLVIDGTPSFGEDRDDDEDDRDDADEDERDISLHDIGEWFRTSGPRRARSIRINARSQTYRSRPLRVRMNPDLALDAQVDAGPLNIRGVRGPVTARVAAGPLRIEGFAAPVDLKVSAGKVSASGRADHGQSTIECDAGKVRLHLDHGSDVRVHASATLGKVGIGGSTRSSRPGARVRAEMHGLGDLHDLGDLHNLGERITTLLNETFSDTHEVVLGAGTADFDVRVSMGAADITFDDDPV